MDRWSEFITHSFHFEVDLQKIAQYCYPLSEVMSEKRERESE